MPTKPQQTIHPKSDADDDDNRVPATTFEYRLSFLGCRQLIEAVKSQRNKSPINLMASLCNADCQWSVVDNLCDGFRSLVVVLDWNGNNRWRKLDCRNNVGAGLAGLDSGGDRLEGLNQLDGWLGSRESVKSNALWT